MLELPEETIRIEAELTEKAIKNYDNLVHLKSFPPQNFSSVTEISGDGKKRY